MAVSTGSKMLQSDLKNWYDTFNTFITTYGGGVISTLTVPTGKIATSNINNLYDKITEFQNDEFLGTQSNWWISGTAVTAGTKFYPTQISNITTTISNMSQVKCRDTYTHVNGFHDNGSETNGVKGNGSQSNGGNSRGRHTYNSRTNSECCCNGNNGSNGTNSNGDKTNGTKSNVNHNNGDVVDITCSRTS